MKLTKHEKSVLEKLLHEAVLLRDNNRCRWCGGNSNLQAAHIFPKGTYPKMRYNLNNVLTLCYRCHFHKWHKNPIEAGEWIRQELGLDSYNQLRLRANYVDKTPFDYRLTKVFLENEIKKYALQRI